MTFSTLVNQAQDRISKFILVACFASSLFASSSTEAREFLVDLGGSNYQTTISNGKIWNNAVSGTTGTSLPNLKDTDANLSSIGFTITDSFWQQTSGTFNLNGTEGSTSYPASATHDSFFIGNYKGYNDSQASIRLSGLSTTGSYTVRLYASRMSASSDDRTTLYTINGTTKELQVHNNINDFAEFKGLTPSNGNLDITIGIKAGSIFGYLGVLDLIEEEPPINTSNGSFKFSLTLDANTSAGVFKKDGTLIRTLWSNKKYTAGTYSEYWDGKDDLGNSLADGSYTIKVLSNNAKFEWEGVIGNTSDDKEGPYVHQAFCFTRDIAIAGGNMYMANGYIEGQNPLCKVSLSAPNKRIQFGNGKSCETVQFVSSDNNHVYWGIQDPFAPTNWMVRVTSITTDSSVSFSNGTPYSFARGVAYPSVINLECGNNYDITGLAVQKTGNYLFIAKFYLDAIRVVDKTSGALVRTLSYTGPEKMCADGSNLWIISGTSVKKHPVNSDGTLGAETVTLNGFALPLSVQVSTDGSTVTVCDGGLSQQVKAFSSSTGQPLWTMGRLGGYYNNPLVYDDKFAFSDDRGYNFGAIAFAPDGTFWVDDFNNDRLQHFSSTRSYLDNVMYLDANYATGVDPNNQTRVFGKWLEYKVDYSKPLDPYNGSWVLYRNWGAKITLEYDRMYNRLSNVATFPNGRTYALAYPGAKGSTTRTLIELDPNTGVRYTGVVINDNRSMIYGDGSLRSTPGFVQGGSGNYTIRSYAGEDSNHNPTWNAAQTLATAANMDVKDPIFHGNANNWNSGELTSSGVLVTFDASHDEGFHVGGLKQGTSQWLWKIAQATPSWYTGEYPRDGWYDDGNGSNYNGSTAIAIDRYVAWGYHGEFWKAGQVNEWQLIYDDGLMIGKFGQIRPYYITYSMAGVAGNAFSPAFAKDSQGNYYLYHNDETCHGGVHRWKISGLNTIQEQSIDFALAKADLKAPPTDYLDLMAGLPINATNMTNVAGWTFTPSPVNNGTMSWYSVTSHKTYNHPINNDISIICKNTPQGQMQTVSRSLGANSGLNSWKLYGSMSYEGKYVTFSSSLGSWFRIVDDQNKVIAEISNPRDSSKIESMMFNGQAVLKSSDISSDNWMILRNNMQEFAISANNGQITFEYAGYKIITPVKDSSANWKNPANLRVDMTSPNAADEGINFSNLRFTPHL